MKILYQVNVHLFHKINILQKLFNKDKILIQEFKVAYFMQSSRRIVIVYLHEDALIMAGSPPFFQGRLQTAHTQHSPLSAIFPFSSFFVAVSTIQGKPASSDGTIDLQKKTLRVIIVNYSVHLRHTVILNLTLYAPGSRRCHRL